MTKTKTKYIHEGDYVAEVKVNLIQSEHEWAPYLSVEDAGRLDSVREALQEDDVKSASRYGRIYRLEPVD